MSSDWEYLLEDYDSNDEEIKKINASHKKYLKKNIRRLSEEKVLKLLDLNPVSFQICNPNNNNEIQFGLLEDEVDEILPDLVCYNDDGNIRSIHYERFDAYYIKIIKIMWDKIKKLEGEIDRLKS